MEDRMQELETISPTGEVLRGSLRVGHEADDVAAIVGNRRYRIDRSIDVCFVRSFAQGIDVSRDHTASLLEAAQRLSVGEITAVAVGNRQPQGFADGQIGGPGRVDLFDFDM